MCVYVCIISLYDGDIEKHLGALATGLIPMMGDLFHVVDASRKSQTP